MKYFEFEEPYYALVKAYNKAQAVEEYENNVGHIESELEVTEVEEVYAYNKFIQSEFDVNHLYEESKIFFNDSSMPLLIDTLLL